MRINKTFIKSLAILILLAAPVAAFAQLNTTQPANAGFAQNIFGCQPSSTNSGVLCIIRAILYFILSIAFIVAVVFLVVGGFRYITSQGNEEGIEKAKGTITNAIIGIVVIVLAWVIVTVVFSLIGTGNAGT